MSSTANSHWLPKLWWVNYFQVTPWLDQVFLFIHMLPCGAGRQLCPKRHLLWLAADAGCQLEALALVSIQKLGLSCSMRAESRQDWTEWRNVALQGSWSPASYITHQRFVKRLIEIVKRLCNKLELPAVTIEKLARHRIPHGDAANVWASRYGNTALLPCPLYWNSCTKTSSLSPITVETTKMSGTQCLCPHC